MLAVLRVSKFKTFGQIGAASAHCDRSRETPNADPSRLSSNRWIVGEPGTMVDAVKARIAERVVGKNGKQRKVRDDAVLAIDLILSASPEYFRPDEPGAAGIYDIQRVKAFEDAAMAWLKKEFGENNIVSVVTHLDEATPHMHCTVVPLTDDGRLNAQQWIQGGQKLSLMQTRYAEAFGHLGIQRGKIKSIADHQRVSEYYANVNAAVAPDVPVINLETPPIIFRESERSAWSNGESGKINNVIQPILQPVADKAREHDAEKQKRISAEYEASKLRRKLERDRVRDIPLCDVFIMCGYSPDRADEHQYKTDIGRISIDAIKGSKFFNHDLSTGGGGAIDLVMHLQNCSMSEACDFLGANFDIDTIAKAAAYKAETDIKKVLSEPPKPVESNWLKVRDYLVNIRKLSENIIDNMHKKLKIYADDHTNACFAYGASGAEIRSTVGKFKGFRGSKIDHFKVGYDKDIKNVAFTESAVEAISFVELYPGWGALSISGSRGAEALVDIAKNLEKDGFKVYAGFNADKAGDKLSDSFIKLAPSVERIRPPTGMDWNDVLKASKDDTLVNSENLSHHIGMRLN